MDQMFVWTVIHTQEIQNKRRSRNWEDDYYRGFEDATRLPRLARRLAARLFSGRPPAKNCHNRIADLDHAGSAMIR